MWTEAISGPFLDIGTGKSLSEALIFASTNPQYDSILFIELPVQYMKIPSSEHGENLMRTFCVFVLSFRTIYVNSMFSPCYHHVLSLEFSCTELVNSMENILSYCGLVNAK